jgi:hypothetical protein
MLSLMLLPCGALSNSFMCVLHQYRTTTSSVRSLMIEGLTQSSSRKLLQAVKILERAPILLDDGETKTEPLDTITLLLQTPIVPSQLVRRRKHD